jgi:hypothetical protein
MIIDKPLILYNFAAFRLNIFRIAHFFEDDSYIDISTFIA